MKACGPTTPEAATCGPRGPVRWPQGRRACYGQASSVRGLIRSRIIAITFAGLTSRPRRHDVGGAGVAHAVQQKRLIGREIFKGTFLVSFDEMARP
jgi:hypothetical protein